jgi:hypothetical protein
MVDNPKLTSFKLIKLDLEQSCRSMCEIEQDFAPVSNIKSNLIANSSD